MTFIFDDGHATSLSVSGDAHLTVTANQPLSLDVEHFARRARIAFDTQPEIPGVDDEIAMLHRKIPGWFAEHGVRAEVTVLATDATT